MKPEPLKGKIKQRMGWCDRHGTGNKVWKSKGIKPVPVQDIRAAVEWLYYWVYCSKCQDRCTNRKHLPHWAVDWDNVEKAFEGVME